VLVEERKKSKESEVVAVVESVAGQQARQEVSPCLAWACHLARGRCKVDHDSSNQSDWSLHSSTTRHARKSNQSSIQPEYLKMKLP